MGNVGMAVGSALWLGFLASISPCPLATNVAAMSFISRGLGSPRRAMASNCFTATCASIWYGFLIATLLFSAKEKLL
jgi:cytochrome c-type biogenesis protein